MRKITNEAQKAFWDNGYFKQDNTTVLNGIMTLHKTIIAYHSDRSLTLNSGGYRTNTTKERLNGVLYRLGYGIRQRKGEWSIYNSQNGDSFLFVDGIQLKLEEVAK